MAYEQVDVYVGVGSTRVPLEGVVVRVYSKEGTQIYGESVTDALGHVGFLLMNQEYTLRFFKFGANFKQPQILPVISDPLTPGRTRNVFDVTAFYPITPEATDPRLCRASGFFRTVNGAPHAKLTIQFIGTFAPMLLEGSAIVDERRTVTTDSDGFACIDLVRCGKYDVTIAGAEDTTRNIRVPDDAACNMPDLLFPVVASVVQPPITVPVNGTVTAVPVVLDSVGVPLPGSAQQDVLWTSSDPTIFQVGTNVNDLTIYGVKKGTAQLLAARRDTSIVRIPDKAIQGIPVQVTVG